MSNKIDFTEIGGKTTMQVGLYNAIEGREFIEVYVENFGGFGYGIELNSNQVDKLIETLKQFRQCM